jgi:hypothetical protein
MRIRIASIPEILNEKYNLVCWGAGRLFYRICKQYEESCFFERVDILIDQNRGKNNEAYEFNNMKKTVYTAKEAANIVSPDSLLVITCVEYYEILEQAMSENIWSGMETVIYMLVNQTNILGHLFSANKWIDQCLYVQNHMDIKKFDVFLKQLLMFCSLEYTKLRFHYYERGQEKISPYFCMKNTTYQLEGEWFINPLEQYSDEQWLARCRRKKGNCGQWLFFIPQGKVKTEWYQQNLADVSQISINDTDGFILAVLDQKRYVDPSQLSIFVISHKQFIEPDQNVYRTIYAGGCQGISSDCLTDCTGDNIADLNEKINECTAIYWIWKNIQCKYIGFNHYRRYFGNIGYDKSVMITGQNVVKLLEYCDILVAQKTVISEDTLYDHLKKSVQYDAYVTGLNAVTQSIQKNQPDYYDDFVKTFQGKFFYPCNMFITRRDICDQYCEWLFSIIIEAARKIDITPYDAYSRRIIGFFAERLLTVWLSRQNLKIGELPILIKE